MRQAVEGLEAHTKRDGMFSVNLRLRGDGVDKNTGDDGETGAGDARVRVGDAADECGDWSAAEQIRDADGGRADANAAAPQRRGALLAP